MRLQTHRRVALGLLLIAAVAFAAPSFSRAVAGVRSAVVDFVYYRDGKPPTGGTAPARLQVSPNPTGRVSVAIGEEFLGGVGQMARSSAWIGAFNASRYTGHALADHRFMLEIGQLMDGPSASMLITATYVALLEGLPIRPDATMTGTINPDMSAGPVGGIPLKMRGAAKAGKKYFGFPVGSRRTVDPITKRPVDLMVLGKQLGLKMTEVRTLDDAIELLTGQRPAARPALSSSDMQLTGEEALWYDGHLEALAKRMTPRAQRAGQTLKRLGGLGGAAGLNAMKNEALALIQKGEALRGQGQYGAAERALMRGSVMLEAIVITGNDLLPMLQGAPAGVVIKKIEQHIARNDQMASAVANAAVTVAKIPAAGAVVHASDALHEVARAQALAQVGTGRARRAVAQLQSVSGKQIPPDLAGQLIGELGQPLVYISAAELMLEQAAGRLERKLEVRPGEVSDEALLMHARSFASAGRASLAYADSVSLELQADQVGISAENARAQLMLKDSSYWQAQVLTQLALLGVDSRPQQLFTLAAGAASYIAGGALLNKLYALQVQEDAQGNTTVGNRRALSTQLELAERRALEMAYRAKEIDGEVPFAARRQYLKGRLLREGDDTDKLDALEAYWTSALFSELVVDLVTQQASGPTSGKATKHKRRSRRRRR